jgi:hypothetical protein
MHFFFRKNIKENGGRRAFFFLKKNASACFPPFKNGENHENMQINRGDTLCSFSDKKLQLNFDSLFYHMGRICFFYYKKAKN